MKKSVVFLLHLGYWALYLLLLTILYGLFDSTVPKHRKPPFEGVILITTAMAIVPALAGFYSFYAILFSKFLKRKKIAALFVSGILAAVVSGLLGLFAIAILLGPDVAFSTAQGAFEVTIFLSFIAVLNGGMGLILKGFISWYKELKLKEELNKKNYEMELALVKNQLSPHFLFNTLNNIDVLIEKDPPRASGYLNQLSDIMRFMLYETRTEKIPLTKELAYIEKYIDLQKIRTANPNYVNYKVEGNPDDLTIAPMLFIPFIENAFKHAENKRLDNAISIRIKADKDSITFLCDNRQSEATGARLENNGLGNELIQKRLELLYPGKHKLEVVNDPEKYQVKLSLDAAAN